MYPVSAEHSADTGLHWGFFFDTPLFMSKASYIKLFSGLIFAITVIGGWYLFRSAESLGNEISTKFDGKRWEVPAIVYARPLELYPSMVFTADLLEKELQLAGYRKENPVTVPGGYFRNSSSFNIITRGFHFPGGIEEPTELLITFKDNNVDTLLSTNSDEELPFFRFDPARIGSFHPLVHEDRIVLESSEIPTLLRRGLMAVEDKDFLSHLGVSPTGVFRALLKNISAGKTVQGGSTLTQQLVKNFFLDRERTISRKLKEAVMAILLEYHYSKDEILTAYINEVFLGQDGNRAVHGFALASQFYFRRDLSDISAGQLATLIGMVKGPSVYDPRKYPASCKARRAVVLRVMLEDNILSQGDYDRALTEPLTDVKVQKNGFNRFPAFLDLVRYQLQSEYEKEDLRGNGLRIHTTLNPQVQWQIEKSLGDTATSLKKSDSKNDIQGAVLVTGRENGEVLGVSGGINPLETGFNRALDAHRPIGSLVKPAIYLAGLEQGYTLASPLVDTAIQLEHGGDQWNPQNYDKKEHGRVLFYQALSRSYNLATVRLGMDIGLDNVIATLGKLGFGKPIHPYPSLLLGAVEMTPLQVSQIYQTIASGGFYLPLRSIQSVMTQDRQLLKRYGLEVEQRFSPPLIQLLTHALERVVSEGTASSYRLRSNSIFAGKTGTSDLLKDSWFAGFSDTFLTVVWLGKDDNSSTSLTGSSGALKVWGNIMDNLEAGTDLLKVTPSPEIVWARIDENSLKATSMKGSGTTVLPFLVGTEPDFPPKIPDTGIKAIEDGARKFFEKINKIFQ